MYDQSGLFYSRKLNIISGSKNIMYKVVEEDWKLGQGSHDILALKWPLYLTDQGTHQLSCILTKCHLTLPIVTHHTLWPFINPRISSILWPLKSVFWTLISVIWYLKSDFWFSKCYFWNLIFDFWNLSLDLIRFQNRQISEPFCDSVGNEHFAMASH